MHEKEHTAVSAELTLAQLANDDAIRLRSMEAAKQHTRQKHGRKGSRQWGFMTPGQGGKRSGMQ